MDFPAHERAESPVHELVPGDRPQARELSRNDLRSKMGVVVGLHSHCSAWNSGTDEVSDTVRGHDTRVHRVILSVMIAA